MSEVTVYTCAMCGKKCIKDKPCSETWIFGLDMSEAEQHISLCSRKCLDAFRRMLDKKFPDGRIEQEDENQ